MFNKITLWIYKKFLQEWVRVQCEQIFFDLFEKEVKGNKSDTYDKDTYNINKEYFESLKGK